MEHKPELTAVATAAAQQVQAAFGNCGRLKVSSGDFEFSIPAPSGSRAGYLVAFSNKSDLWIRFVPPYACYAVESVDELVSLTRQLMTDHVAFKVVKDGDRWVETTLVRLPVAGVASSTSSEQIISWSGKHDAG